MSPLLLRFQLGQGAQGFHSTRQGGGSQGAYVGLNLGLNTDDAAAAVVENRRQAFAAAGQPAAQAVYLRQVHGDRIVEAVAADAGKGSLAWDQGLAEADAVFTRQKGLPLAIGHADCLCAVLADAQAGLLGLAHAGWRGALAGLPGLLLKRLLDEGARLERLRATLSPCLGPQRLQLSAAEHAQFQAAFSGADAFCSPLRDGHFNLDLAAAARWQWQSLGLAPWQIQGQELDTWEHPELFFSHRRDQGRTGRMLTVAWLD